MYVCIYLFIYLVIYSFVLIVCISLGPLGPGPTWALVPLGLRANLGLGPLAPGAHYISWDIWGLGIVAIKIQKVTFPGVYEGWA